jgi:hypothetical protein
VSNPVLSKITSGIWLVIIGTVRSENLIRVISRPTFSTNQLSLAYFVGVTFPPNRTINPLVNSTPLLLV